MHFGVDISSNNPHPMAYDAIVAELRRLGNGAKPFVIVKITQGSNYVNPDQSADIAAFRSRGCAVGGYLMDQGNANVPAEEALYQHETNLAQFDDIELPEGLSVSQYIVHSQALINFHPRAVAYLNQSEVAEGFPEGNGLWLAEYNNQPGTTRYPCMIHQYTSTGTIPGAAGGFDMNVFLQGEQEFDGVFGVVTPITPIIDVKEEDMTAVVTTEVIDGVNQSVVKVYAIGGPSRPGQLLEFTRAVGNPNYNSVIDVTDQIGGGDPYTVSG